MIRLCVLGPTACLDSDGEELEGLVRSPKRLALLAYLAVATPRGFHRRDTLFGLLWPESDQEHAQLNLRQTTLQLRTELGDVLVSRGRDELGVDWDRFACDAVDFETCLAEGRPADALALYGRDLLTGFYVSGAREFERWLEAERARLRQQAAQAVQELIDSTQDPAERVRWARHAVSLAPLDETAARQLMTILAQRGDEVGALEEYEHFRVRTDEGLGMPPGPETQALAGQIRETAERVDSRGVSSPSEPRKSADSSGLEPKPRTTFPRDRPIRRTMLVAGIGLALLITLGMSQLVNRGSSSPRLSGDDASSSDGSPLVEVGGWQRVTTDDGLELYPTLAPDGDEFAYVVGVPGEFDIHVRRVSGGRTYPLTAGIPGNHVWPTWSPDGEQIAFVTITEDGSSTMHVIPAWGGAARVLAESDPDNRLGDPTWSPDGIYIAYTRRWTILKVEVATGEVTELAEPRDPSLLAWSPSGDEIAFVSENREYSSATEPGNVAPTSIQSVSANGGEPRLIIPAESSNQSPVWTPDGRHLLFVSDREGVRDIYVLALDEAETSEPVRVTDGLGLLTFQISRDGSRLAYDTPRMVSNIWTIAIPPDSMAPIPIASAQQLTSGNQWIETLQISPDGQWIAFDANLGGGQDIYRMSVDGGEPIQLTHDREDDFAPAWSPDGQEIAFYSFRSGVRKLFTMDIHGRQARRVTSMVGDESFPSWAPSGNELVYAYGTGDVVGQTYRVTRPARGESWTAPEALPIEETHVPWSPDGALMVTRVGATVVLHSPESGETRSLAGSNMSVPVWDPDTRTLYIIAKIGDRSGIWAFFGVREEPLLLVSIPEHALRRRWLATDRERFFFTEATTHDSDIWVMDVKRLP